VATGEFSDAATLGDGTTAVALEPPVDADPEYPHIVAVTDEGEEAWTWRWPADRSDPLSYVQSLLPASDGGLYLSGDSNTGSDGAVLVAKLTAEREVEWHGTFFEGLSGTTLTKPTPSRAVIVGHVGAPSEVPIHAFGVDLDERTVVWKRNLYDGAMYDPPTTVPYRDGCVLGGNDPASGGLVTRLSGDGSVEWEHTLSDPDVSVSDLVVTPSDDITGIAENESTRNSFDVFTLRGDGERTMRRRLEVEPGTNIHDPQLVLDPAGGYVCAFTYAEKEGVFVGKLSTDGELETSTHVSPWRPESGSAPSPSYLYDLEFAQDQLVGVGERSARDSDERHAWAVGLARGVTTPTPTPTETPTRSPTPSPSETTTRTPSPSPKPSDRPTTVSTDGRDETTATGPGFGVLGTLLGLAGYRYLRSGSTDESGSE